MAAVTLAIRQQRLTALRDRSMLPVCYYAIFVTQKRPVPKSASAGSLQQFVKKAGKHALGSQCSPPPHLAGGNS